MELFWWDGTLLKNPDPCNKFAIVEPIGSWKDMSEQGRAESIYIYLVLPCFVPRIDLLGWILWSTTKG